MQVIEMMKSYAVDNNVPIIEDEGLQIIIEVLQKYNPKSILEIGSAIGYSATMLNREFLCDVTTIERDIKMYNMAKFFVKELSKNNNINLIYGDALDPKLVLKKKFDVIYIDAAKAQNRKFLEKYKDNLRDNGIVIFDNLLFHGFVFKKQEEIESKDLRQLVRKIKEFHIYIQNHDEFNFELIEKGDGIGICTKK